MSSLRYLRPARAATLSVLFVLVALASERSTYAQCVDSSEVNGFKVRSIKFRSLFGRTPKDLQQQLAAHHGEPYSAIQASLYINEIDTFLKTNPLQQKYEKLIANNLKLTVRGTYTELECVRKVGASECRAAFGGTVNECVDVTIRRYAVEIDALNSSPYLLLLPRSALVALYGALPRPLLALNPAFDANQDRRFGPSGSIDTATDLLDLARVFKGEKNSSVHTTPKAVPSPIAPPSAAATPGGVDVTLIGSTAEASAGADAAAESASALEGEVSRTQLLLRLKGRKSLSKDFYDTSTGLTFARTNAFDFLQNIRLDIRFDAVHEPHGNADFLKNVGLLGFGADVKLERAPIRLIGLGVKYRWSRTRLSGVGSPAPHEIGSENGYEARVIADGAIKQGLARAAIWFDGGTLDLNRVYHRVAVMAGYGKEFVIPRKKEFRIIEPEELENPCWTNYADDAKKNEQTVGLEILTGIGRAWGDAPEYARFYGGNQSGQFLYDELNAPNMTGVPSGPLLRGFGQSQAGFDSGGGTRGGSFFWHANVNVSIPVASWTRPLIPHDWVSATRLKAEDKDFQGHIPSDALVCRDLTYMVKRAVRQSGMTLLINQEAYNSLSQQQKDDFKLQEKPDLTPEEQARLDAVKLAYAAAKQKMKPKVETLFEREILPITDFIADQANIFAVKPLLMFDAAYLGLGGKSRTRYAAGGGLQLDVVLARFEFGYLATLKRAPGDPRGNFVGRLVLKRFF